MRRLGSITPRGDHGERREDGLPAPLVNCARDDCRASGASGSSKRCRRMFSTTTTDVVANASFSISFMAFALAVTA
jgi:hypothetical protein